MVLPNPAGVKAFHAVLSYGHLITKRLKRCYREIAVLWISGASELIRARRLLP